MRNLVHYRHEDDSVGFWYQVRDADPPVSVEKVGSWVAVSDEALADVEGMRETLRGLSFGFQRRTWSQRAADELYRFRLGYRVRRSLARLSLGIRGTAARWIYPEGEGRDE